MEDIVRASKEFYTGIVQTRSIMKKAFVCAWSFIYFLLFPFQTVSAQSSLLPLETEESSIIDSGPHFRFGNDVRITEDLMGDVYVAGGDVIIDGNIEGDLLVAGGNVVINGDITEDIRVAGGTVLLNGFVGQDVAAAGGQVTFGRESEVVGSVVVGGMNIEMNGIVMGKAYMGGSEVRLDGTFEQDINGGADILTINEQAVIVGGITMKVGEKPSIASGATITGDQRLEQVEQKESMERNEFKEEVVVFFQGFLMTVLGGAILIRFLPTVMDTAAALTHKSWLRVLGWGVIKLLVVPFVAVLLMVTVIGLPVGIVAILLYIIAIMISGWITAYMLGNKIAALSGYTPLRNRYLQLVIGATIIAVASRLPYVGGIVQLLSLLTGLGALLLVEKQFVMTTTKSKTS